VLPRHSKPTHCLEAVDGKEFGVFHSLELSNPSHLWLVLGSRVVTVQYSDPEHCRASAQSFLCSSVLLCERLVGFALSRRSG